MESYYSCRFSPRYRTPKEITKVPRVQLGFRALWGSAAFLFDEQQSYQQFASILSFNTRFFAVDLHANVNYAITGQDGGFGFQFREDDWVPHGTFTIADRYLPLVRALRIGTIDGPVGLRAGALDNRTIGNGFLVRGYANTLYTPNQPITGATFSLLPQTFGRGYFGIEAFTANLAVFDLIGGRFALLPFAGTEKPVLSSIEIGASFATDLDPMYFHQRYAPTDTTLPSTLEKSVTMWSLDLTQPILFPPKIELTTALEVAFQRQAFGVQLSGEGKVIKTFLFGINLQLLHERFIPHYFDNTYDRRRIERLELHSSSTGDNLTFGGEITAGITVRDDQFRVIAAYRPPPLNTTRRDHELRAQLEIGPKLFSWATGLGLRVDYTSFGITEPKICSLSTTRSSALILRRKPPWHRSRSVTIWRIPSGPGVTTRGPSPQR